MVEIRGSIPLGPIGPRNATRKQGEDVMGIKLEEIEKFAQQFLGFLDDHFIYSTSCLVPLLGKKFPVNDESYFSVELRPSNMGTEAYTLSYIMDRRGIPIEASINRELDYTKFMIKATKEVREYETFGLDDTRENYVMCKELKGYSFEQVRKELRSLTAIVGGRT